MFLSSLQFLDLEDFPNILVLSKDINKKILYKKIFKSLLIRYGKDLDNQKLVLLWKALLNISIISSKYNYEEIKIKMDKEKNKDINNLIEKDLEKM